MYVFIPLLLIFKKPYQFLFLLLIKVNHYSNSLSSINIINKILNIYLACGNHLWTKTLFRIKSLKCDFIELKRNCLISSMSIYNIILVFND